MIARSTSTMQDKSGKKRVFKYIELNHGYIGQVGHEDEWGYFTTEEIPHPHVPEDGRVTRHFYREEVRREWTEPDFPLDKTCKEDMLDDLSQNCGENNYKDMIQEYTNHIVRSI